MSVETGSGAEAGVGWGPPSLGDARLLTGERPVAGSRGFLGLAGRRRLVMGGGIAEVRGPAACMRRDALFRRMLLVADVVAIVGAFVLTVELVAAVVAVDVGGRRRDPDLGGVREVDGSV